MAYSWLNLTIFLATVKKVICDCEEVKRGVFILCGWRTKSPGKPSNPLRNVCEWAGGLTCHHIVQRMQIFVRNSVVLVTCWAFSFLNLAFFIVFSLLSSFFLLLSEQQTSFLLLFLLMSLFTQHFAFLTVSLKMKKNIYSESFSCILLLFLFVWTNKNCI